MKKAIMGLKITFCPVKNSLSEKLTTLHWGSEYLIIDSSESRIQSFLNYLVKIWAFEYNMLFNYPNKNVRKHQISERFRAPLKLEHSTNWLNLTIPMMNSLSQTAIMVEYYKLFKVFYDYGLTKYTSLYFGLFLSD